MKLIGGKSLNDFTGRKDLTLGNDDDNDDNNYTQWIIIQEHIDFE